MPAPEHYYQRHAETPTACPHLQAVITDLAAYYEVDVTQANARFSFARLEHATQWLITNLDGQQIDVARCPLQADDFMVPDIDIVLAMTLNGWQTMQVLHTDAVWAAFVAAESGEPLVDPTAHFPFGTFADYVAHLIEAEIRLEQAREAAELKARLPFE